MNMIILLMLGIVGECSAVLALFGPQPDWIRLIWFLAGHLTAGGCFSLLFRMVVPRQVEARLWGRLAMFFCVLFFIPVFGGIMLLGALIYSRFFQRSENRVEFSSVPMTPFMQESGSPTLGMGEGGAWSRLRTTTLPRADRLKALLAVGVVGGQNASRLLQLAASDSDDEIRLLAFNLSDRREKVISKAISQALSDLRSCIDSSRRTSLCRTLAFAYWEMVFNDLATNDLAGFFVNQALTYACQAYETAGDDPALLVLMGRLQLWLNDQAAAESTIRAALVQGAHRDRVIPYLAELAYRRKDFTALKLFFENEPLLRYKPGIGPVAQFWMGSPDGQFS